MSAITRVHIITRVITHLSCSPVWSVTKATQKPTEDRGQEKAKSPDKTDGTREVQEEGKRAKGGIGHLAQESTQSATHQAPDVDVSHLCT